MIDIVENLRELEAVESELACECDCPPEATANYRYAMTCAEAADEIARLRNELHIAEVWSARIIAGTQQDVIEITRLRAENEKLTGERDSYSAEALCLARKNIDLRAEVVQASQQLGDILAIIHRDGGHHTADVGIEQSVKDAHIKWANLMTENERLRAALARIENEGDGAHAVDLARAALGEK